MNTYFDRKDTLHQLIQKYPVVLDLLISSGLDNLKNTAMLETLGKTITLEQALMMKKLNVDAFEEKLLEAIHQQEQNADSALNKKQENKQASITIQGVLPCPIRIPLLEGFEGWLNDQEEDIRESVDYHLQAASMGVDFIKDQVKQSDSSQVLADLFISAGFDLFFDKTLIGRYKEQGVFGDLTDWKHYNSDFENEKISLKDPKHQYSMLAVVAAVFLVNQEELGDRKMPESWEDILSPEFENAVSLPIGDFDLFNAILLNIYKRHGEEGIKKLGRSLLQSMHPSEMVKSHTKKINKPVVTIMPYFFTKMTKRGGPMVAVWPKDGAVISPIFMLSKVENKEKLKPFIDFFSSKQVAEILSHQGLFPSVHPEVDNLMDPNNPYMWLGWDFIEMNDMGVLIKELEALFHQSVQTKID